MSNPPSPIDRESTIIEDPDITAFKNTFNTLYHQRVIGNLPAFLQVGDSILHGDLVDLARECLLQSPPVEVIGLTNFLKGTQGDDNASRIESYAQQLNTNDPLTLIYFGENDRMNINGEEHVFRHSTKDPKYGTPHFLLANILPTWKPDLPERNGLPHPVTLKPSTFISAEIATKIEEASRVSYEKSFYNTTRRPFSMPADLFINTLRVALTSHTLTLLYGSQVGYHTDLLTYGGETSTLKVYGDEIKFLSRRFMELDTAGKSRVGIFLDRRMYLVAGQTGIPVVDFLTRAFASKIAMGETKLVDLYNLGNDEKGAQLLMNHCQR